MELRDYQTSAALSDQVPGKDGNALVVPLLGLAGEAGELLAEYKKFIRDGEAHRLMRGRVAEELGDILWYLANVATKFDLDLDEVAAANLKKTHGRWALRKGGAADPLIFDHEAPVHQQFPRQFAVRFIEEKSGGRVATRIYVDDVQIGSRLTDNSYANDGYRFHDVFHVSYATVLGWSPVIRNIAHAWKRKYRPDVDEVEDGGRAQVIEEGIAALVFAYASSHNFLAGIETLDFSLLKTIQLLTEGVEVKRCTLGEWERAILHGFEIWRQLVANRGGKVDVDLDARQMNYSSAHT